MLRLALLAIIVIAAGPALAEPISPVPLAKPASLIDPVTLKVNEGMATLSDHADLSERVVLRIPSDDVSWPCRIVRRRETEVGVLFT